MSNPIEIDTRLAELHQELSTLETYVGHAVSSIFHAAGARQTYHGRHRGWTMDFEEAQEKVNKVASEQASIYIGREAAEALAKYSAAVEATEAKAAEVREQQSKYTGWSRFFVVTSSAGHIHSSMNCSTCRPTTTFGWLPYLSGKSEAEAIEFFGPAAECLCSVCFPEAPVAAKDQNLTTKQRDDLLAGRQPEAAPKKEYCPGSGQRSVTEVNWRRMTPSGKCPHCGHIGAVTQSGTMRKHKEQKSNA